MNIVFIFACTSTFGTSSNLPAITCSLSFKPLAFAKVYEEKYVQLIKTLQQ